MNIYADLIGDNNKFSWSPILFLIVTAFFSMVFFHIISRAESPIGTYDVSGDGLADVKEAIWGPAGMGFDHDGNKWPGLAKFDYTYSYNFGNCQTDSSGNCSITLQGVVVNAICSLFIPNWTDYDEAGDDAKAEWDRFIAALKTHEEGHCALYLTDAHLNAMNAAAANALNGKAVVIEKPCPVPCNNPSEEFGAAIDNAVKAILDADAGFQGELTKMANEQDQYDAENQHGKSQNAELACPKSKEKLYDPLKKW